MNDNIRQEFDRIGERLFAQVACAENIARDLEILRQRLYRLKATVEGDISCGK